jgi:hypothetical protein
VSLYSDFKVTGARGRTGSGGAELVEKASAKTFISW